MREFDAFREHNKTPEKIYNMGGDGKNTYIFYADEIEDINDQYHSFKELYLHRHILLCHVLCANKELAFKTLLNDNKEEWEGWFIAGMDTPFGQISYHLPISYWELLPVKEIVYNMNYANDYNSFDVLDRLYDFLISKEEIQVTPSVDLAVPGSSDRD